MKQTSLIATGLAAFPSLARAAGSPNEEIRLAIIGLGNISYRLGRPGNPRACENALGNRPPVAEGFPRLVKSLEGMGVDLDKTPFTLGPWLELDPASGDIAKAGAGDAVQLEQARRLARGSYRAPFTMPA